MEVKCSSGHVMMAYRGMAYPRGFIFCDDCKEERIQSHPVYYHCRQCETDRCRACALKKAGILADKINIAIHEHDLLWKSNKELS